jgi:hypothetical protein
MADFLNNIITGGIPQFLMTMWLNSQTEEKWKEYNAAVEQQIREGRSAREAQIRAMQGMIEKNPHTQEARAILDFQRQDARNQIEPTTAAWGQREADVMGYLEGVGDQSIKDINRTFGEEAGMANSRLVERGLAGGGVGASIAHGFATRKADSLARSREVTGALKAESLGGLRADTQLARERAYERALGQGTIYADFEGGWGATGNEALESGTGAYIDEIYGINNVPPDTSALNQSWSQTGAGFAR